MAIVSAESNVDLAGETLGHQLSALKNTSERAVYAALPGRAELPG